MSLLIKQPRSITIPGHWEAGTRRVLVTGRPARCYTVSVPQNCTTVYVPPDPYKYEPGHYETLCSGGGSTTKCEPGTLDRYVTVTETVWVPEQTGADPTPAWDGAAISVEGLGQDGSYTFKVPHASAGVITGLGYYNETVAYADIPWAMHCAQGLVRVVEYGIGRTAFQGYAEGTTLEIRRTGSKIAYYSGNTLLYESALPAYGTLYADAAFYSTGDTIEAASFTALILSGSASATLPGLRGVAYEGTVYGVSERLLPALTGEAGAAGAGSVELTLPGLSGFASEAAYTESVARLPALLGAATGDAELYLRLSGSDQVLPTLTGYATGLTGGLGSGAGTLPGLEGLSSNKAYGTAYLTLPGLEGSAGEAVQIAWGALSLPRLYTVPEDEIWDWVGASDTAAVENVWWLIERFVTLASASSSHQGSLAVTSSLQVQDVLAFALLLVNSETVTVDGALSASVAKAAVLAEALVVMGAVRDIMTANNLVAVASTLFDEAQYGYGESLADTAALQAATEDRWQAYVNEISTAQMSGLVSDSAAVTLFAASSALTDTALSTQQVLHNLLLEGASAYVTLRLDDLVLSGWVLNTESLGISEYQNYPFNSLCRLGSTYLGAMEGGIYELSGATDDGQPIEARIRTGLMTFGTSRLKHVPTAYLGYTSTGNLVLKTLVTADGEKRERWYELRARTGSAPREGRVDLGRGVKSQYWQFELVNQGGADFSLDVLQVWPVVLDRRV